MERLLRDAEKMGGLVEGAFDIESFADVVEAINIVQTEMGITGTTALEAGRTISGSVGAMKSAWANLITGLADGNADIGQLVDNLVTTIVGDGTENNLGVLGNIMPAVKTALGGAAKLVSKMIPELGEQLPGLIGDFLPMLLDSAVGLVNGLAKSLPELLPILIDAIISSAPAIIGGIGTAFKSIVDALPDLIQQITDVLPALLDVVTELMYGITESWPQIMQILIDAIIASAPSIITGIVTAFQLIVDVLPDLIQQIADALPTLVPQIVVGLGLMAIALAEQMPEIFASVANGMVNLFAGAWDGIKQVFSLDKVQQFFSDVWQSAKNAFGSVARWFEGIFSDAWQAVKDVFSTGGRIFDGIKDGIVNAFKTIVNGIIGGINKVIAVPFNAINGVLRKIKNVNIVGIRPFDWIQTFTVPQIPKLWRGGVLERGQIGLLEGSGAEAVVPLENNAKWISKVADEMQKSVGSFGGNVYNVEINIDGAKYADEQSLAEAVAFEIQKMTDRRSAVYA